MSIPQIFGCLSKERLCCADESRRFFCNATNDFFSATACTISSLSCLLFIFTLCHLCHLYIFPMDPGISGSMGKNASFTSEMPCLRNKGQPSLTDFK
ncbi:hypothetical protein AALO_G00192390 [Alosa alosa]|uniref:Uncharacterized protein n=1 Tax=Alosa alosa TaxID=278164 RepID=A0AAV6G5L6_9TELE|nr:hypothetical protein AALO_G00192390 [Alosa alosa]